MHVLGSFILLFGFAGFLFGVVIIVWPIQSLGFSRRLDGLFVVVAGIAVMLLGQQISPELRQKNAERIAASATTRDVSNEATPAKPISKSEALHNVRIGGFSWEKSGFGSVMKATFVIYNDNLFPVKDVTVTCKHAADSGTIIDSNTRTIYERVDARSYYSVIGMNMGFIHSAVNSSSCRVVNFSRL